jgi:hypothetical protein
MLPLKTNYIIVCSMIRTWEHTGLEFKVGVQGNTMQ